MSTTANTSTSSGCGGGGGGGGGGNNNSSSSGGGGGGGGSGTTGSPCGACKFLRRKCVNGCIFAPYFDSEQGATHFAAVHKVFGASNVSKLLLFIPVHRRPDAVMTICYEAQARLRDPVYGCVAHIFALQQQVVNLQAELSYLQAHLATLELPYPPPPPTILAPSAFSIANLPSAATVPTILDLSTLFDPLLVQPPWTMLQQPWRQTTDLQQIGGSRSRSPTDNPSADDQGGGGGEGGGDLQTLARELLHRQRSLMVSSPSVEPSVPTSSPPPPPPTSL